MSTLNSSAVIAPPVIAGDQSADSPDPAALDSLVQEVGDAYPALPYTTAPALREPTERSGLLSTARYTLSQGVDCTVPILVLPRAQNRTSVRIWANWAKMPIGAVDTELLISGDAARCIPGGAISFTPGEIPITIEDYTGPLYVALSKVDDSNSWIVYVMAVSS